MSQSPATAWPTCVHCGQRRETVCPICSTAGTHFPSADYTGPPADEDTQEPAPPGPAQLLLMCPQCDEVFEPRYYRTCSACGHDFGEGLEPAAPDAEVLDWSPRVLIAIVALVVCCLALMIYFGLLLR